MAQASSRHGSAIRRGDGPLVREGHRVQSRQRLRGLPAEQASKRRVSFHGGCGLSARRPGSQPWDKAAEEAGQGGHGQHVAVDVSVSSGMGLLHETWQLLDNTDVLTPANRPFWCGRPGSYGTVELTQSGEGASRPGGSSGRRAAYHLQPRRPRPFRVDMPTAAVRVADHSRADRRD